MIKLLKYINIYLQYDHRNISSSSSYYSMFIVILQLVYQRFLIYIYKSQLIRDLYFHIFLKIDASRENRALPIPFELIHLNAYVFMSLMTHHYFPCSKNFDI